MKGRLAQLLTDGPSPNPRWLLKFDGQPYKDEEMYERSFRKTLLSVDDEDAGGTSSSGLVVSSLVQRKTNTARRTSESKKNVASSEEDEVDHKESFSDEKKVEHSVDGSNAGSDVDSDMSGRRSYKDRVTAREQRSRRRQAKIEDDVIPDFHDQVLDEGKRCVCSISASLDKIKRPRGDTEDEVVQVNLLTGTLYLYRGKKRRVEFIRRV